MTRLTQSEAEQWAAVAAYEKTNDLVPGTAFHGSSDPEGGQSFEGRARMAQARHHADQPLDMIDRQALERFPDHIPMTTEVPS
ncbi:MAG: hypothetical protein JWN67_5009 [Actinomycetia bacterium]|nr:hypothetical protein [Actinomycetes bacterium]